MISSFCCSERTGFPTPGKFTMNSVRLNKANRKLGVKKGAYHLYSHSGHLAMSKHLSLSWLWRCPLLFPSTWLSSSFLGMSCAASPSSLPSLSSSLLCFLPLAPPLIPVGTLWAGLYGDWQMPDQFCPGTCAFSLHPYPGRVLP